MHKLAKFHDTFGYNLRRLRNATVLQRISVVNGKNAVMKVMYGNRVNFLMMANIPHVRFVGRNCPVEAVQHLHSGNFYCTRRRPMHRYKF